MGLKWPNMTPLKPQTTKLNPKPDPIPAQHTSEIIQQHLQRHPSKLSQEAILTVFYSVFCIFATTKLNPKPDPIPTQHTSEIIQQHLQRHPKMGLKWPNMTPLKPQTTKLNPKPDPIPAQHTSEIIQQHLQRHPKMNLNEPAPPLAVNFL